MRRSSMASIPDLLEVLEVQVGFRVDLRILSSFPDGPDWQEGLKVPVGSFRMECFLAIPQ
jgi:hypothetical protein